MKKIILLLSFLVSSLSALAQQAYNYPYQNPDVASLTTAIMKSKYKELIWPQFSGHHFMRRLFV